MRARLVTLVALAAVLSCSRSNPVEVEYLGVRILTMGGPPGTGPTGALGFTCSEGRGGPPLAQRLVVAGEGCLILDVYSTTGDGACRTFSFTTGPQDRLQRYSQPVTAAEIAACANPDARTLAACVLGATSGVTATNDAPDGSVVLRSVMLAGACPDAATLATANLSMPTYLGALVGCAYSCPVTLDHVTGNVPLYLPVDASFCSIDDTELLDCMHYIPPMMMPPP